MNDQSNPQPPDQRFAKSLVLALVLAIGAAAVYLFATLTDAVIGIHGSEHWLVAGGTAAGGATMWVLAKTGIDLLTLATEVFKAVISPGWELFRSALRTLVTKHYPAILGIVFSAALVGPSVKEIIVPSDPPPIDLDAVMAAIERIDVSAAMTEQKYTTELATELANLQPEIQGALTAQGYTSELAQHLRQLAPTPTPPADLESVLVEQGYTRELAASLAKLIAGGIGEVNIVKLAQDDLRDALDAHEYTTERAILIDKLAEIHGRLSRSHFATFPFAFARGTAEITDQSDEPTAPGRLAFNPEEHDEMIRTIVSALGPCASQGSPVELLVEGYASSEPYDDHPDSDKLNLGLAHARRDNIVAALNSAIASVGASGSFRVYAAANYRDLEDMKRYRGFNDRPADAKDEWFPQDFLTRAAHVQVVGLGLCAIN